jgi:hypothetical protein
VQFWDFIGREHADELVFVAEDRFEVRGEGGAAVGEDQDTPLGKRFGQRLVDPCVQERARDNGRDIPR